MELPASEIVFWQEYFDIYPFTQEREDARAALIAQTVTNMQGRYVENPQSIDKFMPNFHSKKTSLQRQIDRANQFASKLQELKARQSQG